MNPPLLQISVVLIVFGTLVSAGVPDSLRLVNLLYRHGQRTPIWSYPKNPNDFSTTWPEGPGWLTLDGMKMQYSLGRFLRRRYNGFLSDRYDHTQISVLSSTVERCLMSAYSNLAGLYPPVGDQAWSKDIRWQPIPVHTRPLDEDNMLAMKEECPRYNELLNVNLTFDHYRKEEAQHKVFYDFITEKTGLEKATVANIIHLTDTLIVEKQHNVSWPSWVNETIFQRLVYLESLGFDILFDGEGLRRFKGGVLVKDWIDLTNTKVANLSSPIRMNMFSAHDSTVAAVLSALKLFNNPVMPPYTSTVFMELHEKPAGTFHVQIHFRNRSSIDPDDDTQPYPMTIPDCDFECPLDKFISLTKDRLPTDWLEQCSIQTSTVAPDYAHVDQSQEQTNFRLAFIMTVSVGAAAILALLLTILWLCRGKPRRGGVKEQT